MSDLPYDPDKVTLSINGVLADVVGFTNDPIRIKIPYWKVLGKDHEKTKIEVNGLYNGKSVVYTMELYNNSEALKVLLDSYPHIDPVVMGYGEDVGV